MNRHSTAVGALAALLALTACSSSSSPPAKSGSTATSPAAASQGAPVITIKDFGFTGTLTVKPGAKITVTNDDSVAHTLTDKKTKKFDTGNIPANGTATFTAPSAPGSYPFGCTYHPQMAGTLVVQ